MNTYKTLTLYNKHATECRQVKTEPKPRAKPANTVVIKRTLEESGSTREIKIPRLVNSQMKAEEEVKIVKEENRKTVKSGIKKEIRPISPLPTSLVKMENKAPVTLLGFRGIKCEECGECFESKAELLSHSERHRVVLCEECEDEFWWPDSDHQCYYRQYQLRFIAGDIVPTF